MPTSASSFGASRRPTPKPAGSSRGWCNASPNSSPRQTRQDRPGRPATPGIGVSPGPMPLARGRANGGPGGVECSEDRWDRKTQRTWPGTKPATAVTMARMSRRGLVLAAAVIASSLALCVAWGPLGQATTPALAQTDTQQVRVTRVVDGDTIEVSPRVVRTEDVGLIGVDTPEVFGIEAQPCGREPSDFTTEALGGQDVTLEFDVGRVDPYGRALAYVWVPDLDGELINETLLRRGLARVLSVEPNVKYEDRFLAAEKEAKTKGIGVWATGQCPAPESTTQENTTPLSIPPE